MTLKIGCQLDYQSTQETPLILLLSLHKGAAQSIIHETFIVEPSIPITSYIDLYGNHCQRLMMPEGMCRIDATAIVETKTYAIINKNAHFTLIQDLPYQTLIYLLPSRFCESDKLNAQALDIVQHATTGYEMAEAIRQWVRLQIVYEYDRSTSTTSALDTLSAKNGVCRDMAHLAIALCRSINIPTRFVVGYMYQLYPMDLHAWFEAYLEDKWYTFDATQQYVTGGRVIVAYGRDAADVATATYFGDMRLENMNVFVEKIAD